MAHITFIHGIANKPPTDDLSRIWREALNRGESALPLGDYGVTTNFVYWADVMYASPDTSPGAYEGIYENTAEAIDGAGDARIPVASTPEEALFLEQLRSHLTGLSDEAIDSAKDTLADSKDAVGLERVPLPWFIKKRFMAAYLRDVHHYLFDVEHTPRPGETFRVQQEIRHRFVDALNAPNVSRPHVVISHSMGTVIAYDCLKRVSGCPEVDGLMTLGSPLGLDEIQDKLQPEWTRSAGFPSNTVANGWLNVYDRLDPVCGFDPKLGNDYQRAGERVVKDDSVSNNGAWRHSAHKYLSQPRVQNGLRSLLGIDD